MTAQFITTLNLSFVLAVAVTPMANADEWPQCRLSLPIGAITPIDNHANQFGRSIAVSGDLMAVGAPLDDGAIVDGGAVYLMRSVNGEWVHEAKVFASNPALVHQIGNYVAVSGDVMVAGTLANLGRAFVFRRVDGVWQQEQALIAPDEAANDNYGRSVAVSGDWIIVGARFDDDQGNESGSAYLWHYEGGVWVMRQKLLAPDGESIDIFGTAVAIDGDTAIVTSIRDDFGPARWCMFIYELDGNSWQLTQALPTASMGYTVNSTLSLKNGRFALLKKDVVEVWENLGNGWVHDQTLAHPAGGSNVFSAVGSISIDGPLVVVGQPGQTSPQLTGAAYLFRDNGVAWSYERRLQHSSSDVNGFSESVALASEDILVGGRSQHVNRYDSAAPPDCDGDGLSDACELAAGEVDCNLNTVPDSCDLASGLFEDCNDNGILDDPCELHDTYQLDNGVPYGIWGISGNYDMIWLNQFRVRPGGETITHIDIAWTDANDETNVADGTPVTLMIYDDPDNDGHPSDAVLLRSVNTVVRVPRFGEVTRFDRVAIEPTDVGLPTESFFVGAMVRGTGASPYQYAAIGSMTAGMGRSYLYGAAVGTADIRNLSANTLSSNGQDTYHLRAIAADCDFDRELDLCEFVVGTGVDIDGNQVMDECGEVVCAAHESPGLVAVSPAMRLGETIVVNQHLVFASAPGTAKSGQQGSVRLLRFNGVEWEQQGELMAGDGAPNDRFGRSISVRSHYALIGSAGVDGTDRGAAYLFRVLGQIWSPLVSLLPPNLEAGDEFGASLDFFYSDALVGAPGDDEVGAEAGAVHYFERGSTDVWQHDQKIVPPLGTAGSRFGSALAAESGTNLFVGAPLDDMNATDAGSVFMYDRTTSWILEGRMDPDNLPPGAQYGCSLALDEIQARLVVGACGDDGAATASGSLHVFNRVNVTTWVLEAKLIAPDGASGDLFGSSAAVWGDRIIVGAPGHAGVGAAYVFERIGGTWMFSRKLMPNTSQPGDAYGHAVGLTFDEAVVGAPSSHQLAAQGGLIRFNRHTAFDCNSNGIADFCDIDTGASLDADANGIPDECESLPCPADIAPPGGNSVVNVEDLLAVIGAWGTCVDPRNCPADLAPAGGDDLVNVQDLLVVIGAWGRCP